MVASIETKLTNIVMGKNIKFKTEYLNKAHSRRKVLLLHQQSNMHLKLLVCEHFQFLFNSIFIWLQIVL